MIPRATAAQLIEDLSRLPPDTPVTFRFDLSTGDHDADRRANGDQVVELMTDQCAGDPYPSNACFFIIGEADPELPKPGDVLLRLPRNIAQSVQACAAAGVGAVKGWDRRRVKKVIAEIEIQLALLKRCKCETPADGGFSWSHELGWVCNHCIPF